LSLLDGLFGPSRRLYKRLARYSLFEEPQLYQRLARRPYSWLVRCTELFAAGKMREVWSDGRQSDRALDRMAVHAAHLLKKGATLLRIFG